MRDSACFCNGARRLGLVASLLLGTGACPTEPSPEPQAQWSVADEAGLGVMLGAHLHGSELWAVGGVLSPQPGSEPSGPGRILRREGEEWCVEELDGRALWWMHGRSPERAWIVGDEGQIWRVEGSERHDESVPTDATLYGVYERADGVVHAVGGTPLGDMRGELWRRDLDGTWSAIDAALPAVAFKVWEDWIVGDGVAWKMDGDQLVEDTPAGTPKLLTVSGRSADDVWAVGGTSNPKVFHHDGSAWSEIELDPFCFNGGLNGVWTAPDEDVWVAGFFGTMAAYDGDAWRCPEQPMSFEHFHAAIAVPGAVLGEGPQGQSQGFFFGGNLLNPGGDKATVGSFGNPLTLAEPPPCSAD